MVNMSFGFEFSPWNPLQLKMSKRGKLSLWCQKGVNYVKKGVNYLVMSKRGQLSCDVQNKPFCGSAAGDEYQMAHMVTTKSFASRGWIASVEGSILAIHSDDLPSFVRSLVVAPFKNKWRACEGRSPAGKILSGNLISHRIAAVFLYGRRYQSAQAHLWWPQMSLSSCLSLLHKGCDVRARKSILEHRWCQHWRMPSPT